MNLGLAYVLFSLLHTFGLRPTQPPLFVVCWSLSVSMTLFIRSLLFSASYRQQDKYTDMHFVNNPPFRLETPKRILQSKPKDFYSSITMICLCHSVAYVRMSNSNRKYVEMRVTELNECMNRIKKFTTGS